MLSFRQEQQQRAAQFAAQRGLKLHPRLVTLVGTGQIDIIKSPQDAENAQEILRSVQTAKSESEPRKGLSRMLTSKSRPTQFKCREICAALSFAVNNSKEPGIVDHLLGLLQEQGGNVNIIPRSITVWKKVKNIDQQDQRTGLLRAATRLVNTDVIGLLIPHADQLSLDESLSIALMARQPNLDVIDLLLSGGANAGTQHALFISAVDSSNQELVSLLLSAPKPVASQCMTEALWSAVNVSCLEMTFLLAMSEADADSDNGRALKTALQNNQPDLVMALTFAKYSPSTTTLDEAVQLVFLDESTTVIQQLKLVEILLSAGAKGAGTNWALVHVVKLCSASPPTRPDPSLIIILKLLVRFKASLEFNDSAALKIVIQSSFLNLIDIFLNASTFNAKLATIAFASIDQATTENLQLSIASKLLEKGATGTPLHEALIYAVQTDHSAVVEMLVVRTKSNKASVNYREAAALKNAVSRERINLVKILLSGGPSISSVSTAFPYIWSCSKEGRFVLATELLGHKARGEPVNIALATAVQDHTSTRDERLIRLLVRKGASINFENGKAIEKATNDFDMVVLDILLSGQNLDPKSLNAAFASAILLRSANRLTVSKKLLEAGAVGGVVDKALVVAVKEEPDDTSLLRLLAPKADVNYNGGEALSLAITNSQFQHAKLLVKERPNEMAFDNAFRSTLNHSSKLDQLNSCRMLLESSPAGLSASTALLKAVQAENSDLCDLMLEFKASANSFRGAAVIAAVQALNTGVLTSLVQNSDPPLSEESLTAAFESALVVKNEGAKFQLVKILLEAGLKGKTIDAALVSESKHGDANLAFCSLLLHHKARPDHQNGESLNIATKKGSLRLLRKILESKRASEASLSRSFITAQSLSPRTRSAALDCILKAGLRSNRTQEQIDSALLNLVQSRPPDMSSLKVLLEHGASVHFREHSVLKHSAGNSDTVILQLLLEYVEDDAASSIVFDSLEETLQQGFWKNKPGFDTLELLLKNGAQGESVNKVLISAITTFNMEPLAEPLMDLLLKWNADVNYNSGRAISIAATQGNIQIIPRLFVRNASVESSLMALPYLFISGVNEEGMLSLFQLFVEYLGQDIARPFEHPELPDAIVFLSIRHYPKSHRVLKAVLDTGFLVDQRMYHELGEVNQRNFMTALFWALSLPGGIVAESVIETLLLYGASVNDHPQPLLHLAISKSYSRVVKLLIEAGVDVNFPSAEGFSPLSIAFQKRDIDSMELLAAKADSNDGTLHDAAQYLDLTAMELLIAQEHDPDFPSLRHDGRTALAELCYRASQYAPRCTESEVKKSIKTLINGGAQINSLTITEDDLGRSLLHMALDSSKPYLMTKSLLESGLYKHVNDDFNLYNDGEYTYSPIMYVEKGVWEGAQQNRQPVLNLLKKCQVRRRFWRNEGPQPPDMVDAPPDIVQAEKQRKADLVEQQRREFEMHERLRLKEVEAQAAIAIKQREHEITKRLDQDRHQTELTALQARLRADLTYQQSRANIENQRNAQQLENMRAQKAIEFKNFSDMKAIEQQHRQQQIGLVQEERRLVDSRTALGQTTMQVAAAEMAFRKQNGLGSSRPALGDVSGRSNRFIED